MTDDIPIIDINPNSSHPADKILFKYYSNVRANHVQVGSDKVFFGANYRRFNKQVKNFTVNESDVWVVSYPKSGSNWLQEIVWCICNGLDFEKAKSEYLSKRFPSIDTSLYFEKERLPDKALAVVNKCPKLFLDSLEYVKDKESPRFIKTHIPLSLLPDEIHTKKPKIIYIVRKPKDMCCSYIHHLKVFEIFTGDISHLVELLIHDRLLYTPYFKHVRDFYEASKSCDNILFIRFEDLKLNTKNEILKICNFLGKSLTDSEIDSLIDHTSVESMKNNKSVNRKEMFNLPDNMQFIRKGAVDSHKEELSPELIEKIDEWVKLNTENTELDFLQ